MTQQRASVDLFSWNVNGLRDPHKATLVTQQMYRNKGIHMLQQIHQLSPKRIKSLQKSIPFCYHKNGSRHTKGVLLSIPQRNPNINHFPSSMNLEDGNDRLILSKIEWFGQQILLVNIYAPASNQNERATFFETLHQRLHTETIPIILAGDFNCWLSPLDKRWSPDTNIPVNLTQTADRRSLSNLLSSLQLIDVWREQNQETTQFTYGRSQNEKISRLDKFYVSQSILHLIQPNSCKIIPTPLSDHNICKITLMAPNGEQNYKSRWRLNNRLLQLDGYRDKIITTLQNHYINEIENNQPDDVIFNWYEKLKYKLRSTSRSTAIGRSCNLKLRLDQIQIDITNKEREPQSPENKALLEILYRKLHKTHSYLSIKSHIRSSISRAENFEKNTKAFFALAKPPNITTRINTLKKTDNSMASSQQDIEDTACDFYEQLFGTKNTDEECQHTLLNSIKNSVPPGLARTMDQPITIEEIKSAIANCGNNKAPGPDGITAEFYKTFVTDLAPILEKVYNKCRNGIPTSMKESIICLLFKKGEKADLKNWRPISLLNVDYKILTKIINERMKKTLTIILHPDQKGFVPTRRLDDAILKVQFLIDYCKRNGYSKYLLFLDQEKAFDRVDRDFMHKILEKFNFPPFLRDLIKSIYNETPARLSINGKLTRSISLHSGVRQGCPLSPTLFALCIETLGNLIRDNVNIPGIEVPNVGIFKLTKFADDTTIFINNTTCLDETLNTISIYEHGSGAKANISKTEIFPIGVDNHDPDINFPQEIQILPYNAQVRFLGVYLTNTILTDEFWNERIQKLKTNLQIWNQYNLTYQGRVLVLRTQALGAITFHAKFNVVPPTIVRKIDNEIKNFVRKGKKKFIINYEIAKLPRELGGLNIPDIDLHIQSTQLSLLQPYLDDNNRHKIEWLELANQYINSTTNHLNLNENILRYKKYSPKGPQTFIFPYVMKLFHKHHGQVESPNCTNITTKELFNEPLSTYTIMDSLNNSKISQVQQVVETIHSDGQVQLYSSNKLKELYSLRRKIPEKTMRSLLAALPTRTRPPNHIFYIDENSSNILCEINQDPNDSTSIQAKRYKQDGEPTDLGVIEFVAESPPEIYTNTRNQDIDLLECTAFNVGHERKRYYPEDGFDFKVKQTNLSTVFFNIGEEELRMKNYKPIIFYNLNIKTRKLHHQHAPIFQNLTEQPDWPNIPNRRIHPILPYQLKELRFRTIHNRHYIGRQRIHLPNVPNGIELCPRCHFENNILHLILDCPAVTEAWRLLQLEWEILLRIFKEEMTILTNIPTVYLDGLEHISQHQKLFGVATPSKSPSFYKYLIINTLDIFLGNMQYTIIQQFKREQPMTPEQYQEHDYIPVPMTSGSLFYEWRHHMKESILLLTTRMKFRDYKTQWIYSKTTNLPDCIDEHTWRDALSSILQTTARTRHILNLNLELTSELESSQLTSDL